ncbi:hypothetical protein BASA83_002540 [Batrachochytrium salamandrivorans]|nr:hypothetical protein BASA83_002540 [Batrachochytrium salamandrivorans]
MIGFGSDSQTQPSTVEATKHRHAHDVMARPCFSRTAHLRSGEQVSYSEIGDKKGYPVLWFAGPCSNRLLMAIYEDMAIEFGLYIICFDRPGRGASTPLRHPKLWEFRSLAAYANELMTILGIEKFFIIGHSIGASYALACYDTIKHRVLGPLRFLATWAPSNLPCMPVSYALQRSLPTRMLRGVYSMGYSTAMMNLSSSSTVPSQMGAIGSREAINTRDRFVHQVLERVNEDHIGDAYKAFEIDWLLALEINKPFGFDHRTLQCAVKCWHGMDDTVSPLGAAMWMQREMKQFLLYAVEGATHNILLDFAIVRAIFADISKEAAMILVKPIIETDDPKAATVSAADATSDLDSRPPTPISLPGSEISRRDLDAQQQIPTPATTPTGGDVFSSDTTSLATAHSMDPTENVWETS